MKFLLPGSNDDILIRILFTLYRHSKGKQSFSPTKSDPPTQISMMKANSDSRRSSKTLHKDNIDSEESSKISTKTRYESDSDEDAEVWLKLPAIQLPGPLNDWTIYGRRISIAENREKPSRS